VARNRFTSLARRRGAFVLSLALFSIFANALLAGSLTPPGAPAPTMRSLDEIAPGKSAKSLPFVVDASGPVICVANLGSSGQDGITINADNVVLDLGGFTLTGPGSGSQASAVTILNNHRNIVIKNGSITGWGTAISCPGQGNDTDLYLSDIKVSSCGANAPAISCARGKLASVVVMGAPGGGVAVRGSSSSDSSFEMSDCKISLCSSSGLSIAPVGSHHCIVSVLSCDFVSNGVGISCTDGDHAVDVAMTIRASNIGSSGQDGVLCSMSNSGSSLVSFCDGSVFTGNTGSGMKVSMSDFSVMKSHSSSCSFSRNGGSGLSFVLGGTGRCSIENEGTDCDDNMGNGFSSVCALRGPRQTVSLDCSFSHNGASGVSIQSPPSSSGGGTGVIAMEDSLESRRCTCSGNTLDGMLFSGAGFTLSDCVTEENGSHGMDMDSDGDGLMESCKSSGNGGNGYYVKHVSNVKWNECVAGSNGACGILIALDVAGKDGCSLTGCSSSNNGQDGVSITDGLSITLQDVSCSGNGGDGFRFKHPDLIKQRTCSSSGNLGCGFRAELDGSSKDAAKLEMCDGSHNALDGFRITDADLADLTDITSHDNGGCGYWIKDSFDKGKCSFERCAATSNGSTGIVCACTHLRMHKPQCVTNAAGGMYVSCPNGACIEGAVADGNTSHGLEIDGSRFQMCDSQLTGNTGDGLHVSSGTGGSVCRNLACANFENGLYFATGGHTVHDNSGNGNESSFYKSLTQNDVAPQTPAATATSPVTNIVY